MITYFAHVVDGVVVDVHVVTAEFIAANPDLYQGNWIETFRDVAGKTYAGIGYVWNGTDFSLPPILNLPPLSEE